MQMEKTVEKGCLLVFHLRKSFCVTTVRSCSKLLHRRKIYADLSTLIPTVVVITTVSYTHLTLPTIA